MRHAFKTAAGISFAMLFSSAISAADITPLMPPVNLPQIDFTTVLDAVIAEQTYAFDAPFIQNNSSSNSDLMRAYNLLLSSAKTAEKRHIKKPQLTQLLKGRSLEDFVRKLDPDKSYSFDDLYPLIGKEIHAMLSSIDPHSYYEPPQQQREHSDQLSGQRDGFGFYYESDEEGIRVTGIVNGSPAEKSSLKQGDIITQIDGVKLGPDAKDQFVDYIHTHNDLSFGITKNAEQPAKTITLSKGKINSDSLDVMLINDEVAYVTLFVFTKSTNDEFKEKFTQLNETHGSKIKSLVFDLRDNGGGMLGAATDLADSLTKQDLLLGIIETTESSYHAAPILGDGEHQITDLPISIVINSNSASSAEIFAGILQDYKRAKIIGQTQSYGKGTFQEQFLHMIDGKLAGMSITTGYIGLPLSGPYQGKGIWPDIQVTDARMNLALAEQNGAQTLPSYERDLKNYMNLTKAPNDAHIDPSYTCQIPSDLKNAFIKTTQVYSTVSQTIDMSEDPDFLCAIDQYNTQRQYSLTFKAKPIELN